MKDLTNDGTDDDCDGDESFVDLGTHHLSLFQHSHKLQLA